MPREIKTIENAIKGNWWFYALAGIAIVLIIASWFVPPMAVIDGSVLAAVGEIFGFAALGTVIKAIDKGTPASLTHNGTTISVNKENAEDTGLFEDEELDEDNG